MHDTATCMTPQQRRVWESIRGFDIDGGEAAFPFVARLARDNAWPGEFAARVVEEYRRFVFLAMCAGHPVTPSDQVDQAWHLHLTYTRSYWERMCGGVLPKPLHHDPTRGGAGEDAKFDEWYGRTKASYERLFGEAAPADIWPDAETRFHDDVHYARVHTRENIIIPRARVRRALRLGGVMLVPGVVMSGCGAVLLSQTEESGLPVLLFVFLGIFVVWGVIVAVRAARGKGGDGGGSGCGFFWGGGCGSDNHDGGSGCGSSGCGGGGCGGGGD